MSAPGIRFVPNDEELISYYLYLKIRGSEDLVSDIAEINVCKHEPWDLPYYSKIKSNDPFWYFFCPRHDKYKNSRRANRTTELGYWKGTGKARIIKARGTKKEIGFKKTLVFHLGRAPHGVKTKWVMHEFHLPTTSPEPSPFVICRLKEKEDGLADISTSDEGEPSHQLPIACENQAATTPELTPQPLADLQFLGKNIGQDCNFPSAQELQFHVEQGGPFMEFPFTDGFSNGFEGTQSQFNTLEWEEAIDFATSVQVNLDGYPYYPYQEHVNILLNDSSPSDSSRRLSGGDSSYTDSVTINARENIFPPKAAIGGYSSNST